MMFAHQSSSQEANVGFDGELNFDESNNHIDQVVANQHDLHEIILQQPELIFLHNSQVASPSSPSGGQINLVSGNGSQDEDMPMEIDEDFSSH